MQVCVYSLYFEVNPFLENELLLILILITLNRVILLVCLIKGVFKLRSMAEASRCVTNMAENIKQLKHCNKKKLPEAGQSCVSLWSQIHSKLWKEDWFGQIWGQRSYIKKKNKGHNYTSVILIYLWRILDIIVWSLKHSSSILGT